jgi:hypothetical protein
MAAVVAGGYEVAEDGVGLQALGLEFRMELGVVAVNCMGREADSPLRCSQVNCGRCPDFFW